MHKLMTLFHDPGGAEIYHDRAEALRWLGRAVE